ncbi:MAG: DUF721 domain-containing protein [Coriobacteriia bacterium]|nr:DUF721 domain-containing protein [Coriobacteriia bacterium]
MARYQRSRKTRDLKQLASGVLKRADKEGRRFGAQAVSVWGEIAGPEIARHTKGFALRGDRELVVFVDGAAWANQLALMSEELLGRLEAHLGEKTVRSLRFTVSRRVHDEILWEANAGVTEEFYVPDETPGTPLDHTELQQAAHVAAAVRNPAVREVALRAMIKDLEQKKSHRQATSPQPQTGSSETPANQG